MGAYGDFPMTTAAQRSRRQPPKRAPRPSGVRVRRQWSSTHRRAYRLASRVHEHFTRAASVWRRRRARGGGGGAGSVSRS